jgi:MYXO-CTERM domain-containing protein
MKKLLFAAATVVALMSVVPLQAIPAPVPEPSSFVQLAAGLFVLGGLALVARKRTSRNEAE